MKTITLGDLCTIIAKEEGFYITDLKDQSEMFFQDSDDFYERPFARYLMERQVYWICVKDGKPNIVLL